MTDDKKLIVAFPLYPGCTLVDFAGATQIFAAPSSGFKPVWLAKTCEPVETSDGVSVMPNATFDDYMKKKEEKEKIAVVFVPGGEYEGVAKAMADEALLQFLHNTASPDTWTGSVCTGAFILAAAGILHDCEATTHWAAIPVLQMLSEKLKLTIPEGYPRGVAKHRHKPFTGGGISSSLDLALEIVIALKDREHAEKSQLLAQYQPDPPTCAGDPNHAPAEMVEAMRQAGKASQEILVKAVNKLLNSHS
ncbi:MAG: DJ-1/PfpI family protein [Bacteroidetes bacterium]|nr:MAG: DJ-1/PfpI family protein [Bacteroidota bacterium]